MDDSLTQNAALIDQLNELKGAVGDFSKFLKLNLLCKKCYSTCVEITVSQRDGSYVKKCEVCNLSYNEKIPKPKKQTVYLDQYIISNFAKTKDPNISPSKKEELVRWSQLYESIRKAVYDNTIVCPSSNYHHLESSLTPLFSQLEEVWEELSFGLTFKWEHEIEQAQLLFHLARNHLKDMSVEPVTRLDVLNEDYETWPRRFQIRIPTIPLAGLADEVRNNKAVMTAGLRELFNKTFSEDKSFEEHYNLEVVSGGDTFLRMAADQYDEMFKYFSGDLKQSVPWVPGPQMNTMEWMSKRLESIGRSKKGAALEIANFFRSPECSKVPYIHLSALLFAGLAMRVKQGQKKIGESFYFDVFIVSRLAPYCDAMFVDASVWELLKQKNVTSQTGLMTKFFSTNNLDEFERYLKQAESEISFEQRYIQKVIYAGTFVK